MTLQMQWCLRYVWRTGLHFNIKMPFYQYSHYKDSTLIVSHSEYVGKFYSSATYMYTYPGWQAQMVLFLDQHKNMSLYLKTRSLY